MQWKCSGFTLPVNDGLACRFWGQDFWKTDLSHPNLWIICDNHMVLHTNRFQQNWNATESGFFFFLSTLDLWICTLSKQTHAQTNQTQKAHGNIQNKGGAQTPSLTSRRCSHDQVTRTTAASVFNLVLKSVTAAESLSAQCFKPLRRLVCVCAQLWWNENLQ